MMNFFKTKIDAKFLDAMREAFATPSKIHV